MNELYARTLFSPGGVALVDVNIDDAMRRKILKIKNKLNNGDIYVEYKNELIEAFGKIFEKCIETREIVGKKLYVNTEEFVEDKFAVDIKYNLKIDCKVEKTGFVARLLREMISKNIRLRLGRKLIFFCLVNQCF